MAQLHQSSHQDTVRGTKVAARPELLPAPGKLRVLMELFLACQSPSSSCPAPIGLTEGLCRNVCLCLHIVSAAHPSLEDGLCGDAAFIAALLAVASKRTADKLRLETMRVARLWDLYEIQDSAMQSLTIWASNKL